MKIHSKSAFGQLSRTLLCVVFCFASIVICAAPTIDYVKVSSAGSHVVVLQYNVSGATEEDAVRTIDVLLFANGTNYVARSLSGATNCVNGAHRVYWDMAKDGLSLDPATASLTVAYKSPLYCIIDLSGGTNVEEYAVSYLNEEPDGGFNTIEYKTTKLVLKRVDAGSFTMGNSSESDSASHTVTLTKPFYMGLFEVTKKQWQQVMGENPCYPKYGSGDSYPVRCVSYDMIRGSSEGAKWPASNAVDAHSFLGKLRDRTKIDFDLPTEAQWEYVCRAGMATAYSYKRSINASMVLYQSKSSSLLLHSVGSKSPNGWGFYDMHGNVSEWCLDWFGALMYGTDPKGLSSGSKRVLRGGIWCRDASECNGGGVLGLPKSGSWREHDYFIVSDVERLAPVCASSLRDYRDSLAEAAFFDFGFRLSMTIP